METGGDWAQEKKWRATNHQTATKSGAWQALRKRCSRTHCTAHEATWTNWCKSFRPRQPPANREPPRRSRNMGYDALTGDIGF
jgi:hypothetical protein